MSSFRVECLDGIKTGTIVANSRQGSDYNSSTPTLGDGDPCSRFSAARESGRSLGSYGGDGKREVHFLAGISSPGPRCSTDRSCQARLARPLCQASSSRNHRACASLSQGHNPLPEREGQQREKGVPRLWPGPQGCILSDLARLAESTEQPGEEGAERKEKPSAALPLPSQLIRGTTGARGWARQQTVGLPGSQLLAPARPGRGLWVEGRHQVTEHPAFFIPQAPSPSPRAVCAHPQCPKQPSSF